MSDLQIVKDVIRNTAVIADKIQFTYVQRLFPELPENSAILLICKKILSSTGLPCREISVVNRKLTSTDHDVTGSPLEHSFGDDVFNVTVISEKRNWSKDEEYHFPLEKFQASFILNSCLDNLGKEWSSPLFVLCDGLDNEKTVLLGSFVVPEWFSTMKVCTAGLIELSKAHDCNLLMQEHLKLASVQEREVQVAISSIWEFRGTNRIMSDWSETERVNFDGYLSLELSWNSMSFLPPTRVTSNYLLVQIAAGWKDSPMRDLWDQLLLLDKYLTILETYQKKNVNSRYSVLPLKFPQDFNSPYNKGSENILEKLNILLSGDDAFEDDNNDLENLGNNKQSPFESETDLDDNIFLRTYLKELPSRQNLDFTDQLWHLIIGANDYAQMADCLHTVFEEIVHNDYKPQINGTRQTLIANLIAEFNTDKPTIPSLVGSLPLELVIDMGMQKMSRDYTYLLLRANFSELHDVRKKLVNVTTEKFNTDKYRKRLLMMAQIHLCLEFLLLVQNNMDCSMHMSNSLFDYAMRLYTSNESPVKSFVNLIDNTIYTLKAPGSNAIFKEVTKTSPSSWRATLSSTSKARKLTTTTHYSHLPIFPPNIYSPGDPIEGEETFHVTKAITSSYKIH